MCTYAECRLHEWKFIKKISPIFIFRCHFPRHTFISSSNVHSYSSLSFSFFVQLFFSPYENTFTHCSMLLWFIEKYWKDVEVAVIGGWNEFGGWSLAWFKSASFLISSRLFSTSLSLQLDSFSLLVLSQQSTQSMCVSFYNYNDDDEKVFLRWEGGKKFSFNKLTYSINIDGVSRCPLSMAMCVYAHSYQLRMNHYDMVTVFYSLRIFCLYHAQNKLKMKNINRREERGRSCWNYRVIKIPVKHNKHFSMHHF